MKLSTVTIASRGWSDWMIVEASPENEVCRFAIEELRKYLLMVSGCEFITAHDAGDYAAITVGLRSDLRPEDLALLPASMKGHDGYSLAIEENRIVVAGDNERGVVYGIYDLLERIGCRWFYPQQDPSDVEVVPELERVVIETQSRSVASPMSIRIDNPSSFYFEIEPDTMKRQLDAAMKARYNGIGWQCDHRTHVGDQYKEMERTGVIAEMKKRGMLLHGPAHSYPHFMRNEYFEEHPEWFGERDGKRVKQEIGGAQFCCSNEEARRKFVENAEQFVLDSPGLDIFCTLGFDGGIACACPQCAGTTAADLVVQLMNEVVERLRKSAPHVLVEMSGAYNPVHEPPENTKADDALRVIWAHWGRYHGYGYDDPRYGWIENLETWRKAFPGRLTLCQYYTDNFATPWISAPYPIVLEGDRRYCLDKAVDAVYMLMWPPGYWWNHSLNNYMAGLCYYDFSLNPWDVIRNYALHYFGRDAGPLLAAYLTQWAQNVDLPYHVKDGTTETDRAALDEQRRFWIEPAVEAVKGDPLLSHRVGKVAKLHDLAERLDELHRRHAKISKLREAGDFEKASELIPKARDHAEELLAHMSSLAELNQGLIDKNEVSGFIRLGVTHWIGEEEKAVEAKSTKLLESEKSTAPD